MGTITILNGTNVPINSCISAGVNYSWVNALYPNEYYVHNGAVGVYTLNSRYWLGEASEYANSGAEIGIWIAGLVVGIVGLVLAIPTGGVSLELSAAVMTAAAAVGVGGAGLAICGIAIAAKEFSNEPSRLMNIQAVQNRVFIATGNIEMEYDPGAKITTWTEIPGIEFEEISQEDFANYKAKGYSEHGTDVSHQIPVDSKPMSSSELTADKVNNVPVRIAPMYVENEYWEIEDDSRKAGTPLQLWNRPKAEEKVHWLIEPVDNANPANELFCIRNQELDRYARVDADGRLVASHRSSATEFKVIKSRGQYALLDDQNRLVYPEKGNLGDSTKLIALKVGARGNPTHAHWVFELVDAKADAEAA